MAIVSISEAARLAGKGRSTIQRHIKSGKLSASQDAAGNPVIDTSELCRAYGAIQVTDVSQSGSLAQDEAVTVETLREELRAARERERAAQEREEWLKKQLEVEQERSRELERRMLPPGKEKKGFFARVFGR